MGQAYVLVSNCCFLNEGLCPNTGRAGEEATAKSWTQKPSSPSEC